MKEYYKHTQVGYLVIVAVVITLFLFLSIVFTKSLGLPLFAFMFLIMFLLLSFSSLTVTVDDKYLKVKFGYGIFKKHFLLDDISSVEIVKNRWYYGWGIRIWFWPRMYIYNISGFDAVEVRMKGTKVYRIGTDEPKKLKNALESVLVER